MIEIHPHLGPVKLVRFANERYLRSLQNHRDKSLPISWTNQNWWGTEPFLAEVWYVPCRACFGCWPGFLSEMVMGTQLVSSFQSGMMMFYTHQLSWENWLSPLYKTVFPDSLPRFHGSCQFCIRLFSTLSPFRKFFQKDLNAFQSRYIDGEWTFWMITHRIKRELPPLKTNKKPLKNMICLEDEIGSFPFKTTTTNVPLSGGGTYIFLPRWSRAPGGVSQLRFWPSSHCMP